MAVTSLIKPVQNKKGIFYNFQSALEDINITLSNSENAVRFSKFVLLRVPEQHKLRESHGIFAIT